MRSVYKICIFFYDISGLVLIGDYFARLLHLSFYAHFKIELFSNKRMKCVPL